MTSVHNILSDLHNSADHTFMYESRIQLLGYIVSATTRNNRDNRRMTHTNFVALETSAVNESRGVREFRGSRKMLFISACLGVSTAYHGLLMHTAFSRKVVGKNCARDNPER